MRRFRTALLHCAALVAGLGFIAPEARADTATEEAAFQTALNAMGFHDADSTTGTNYQFTKFVGSTSSAISAVESFAANMRGGMSHGVVSKTIDIASPYTASPQSAQQLNKRAVAIVGWRNADGSAAPVSKSLVSGESALLVVGSDPVAYSSAAAAGVKPSAGGDGANATAQILAGQAGAAFGGSGGDAQAAAATASAGQGQGGAKGGLGGAAIAQSTGSSGARMAVAVGGEGGDGSNATAAGANSGNETTGLNGGAGGDGGTASAIPGGSCIGVAYTRSGGDGGDGGYGSSLGGSGAKGGTAGLSLATATTALAYHFATSAAGGGAGGDGGHSSGTGGGGGKGGAGGSAQANGDNTSSAAVFAQGGTGGVGGDGGDGSTPGAGGAAGSAGSSTTTKSSLAAAIPGYAGTPGSGGAAAAGIITNNDPVAAALAEEQQQRLWHARTVARADR